MFDGPERRGSFYEIRYENDSQNREKRYVGYLVVPGDLSAAGEPGLKSFS